MDTPHADVYLTALRRELEGSSGDHRDAVLTEIERVGGSVPDVTPRKRGTRDAR